MNPRAIAAWLEPRQGEMLALLRAWVETETPSLEPERVAAFARAVGASFAPLGYQARLHSHGLELQRDGAAEGTLVLGHLDTVYPAGTLAAMPFRAGGDRAHGPGVYDMKGGLVQALFALRAVAALMPAAALPSPLLFVYDEETGSRGSRALTEARARAARRAVVLEPAADADGKLKVARKGIALYQIAAHGRAAHAGVDFEQGASAVAEIAALIAQVSAWSDAGQGITVNCGLMSGGTRVNVVAAEARAELEMRAWSAGELEALDQRLRRLKPRDRRVELELEGGINRPPLESSEASLELARQAQALARELGFELGTTRSGGGSDGNFTAAAGCPTLDGMGLVGGGAHAPDEHIELSALVPRTALLAALLPGLR
ncbi:MAG TPA: M20/M25/M40 family metallo-hydrolase [Terriglobales bacterium]|nr:M20/M25/M40 family metallo-hydrolase [Terriglobales bacterium]